MSAEDTTGRVPLARAEEPDDLVIERARFEEFPLLVLRGEVDVYSSERFKEAIWQSLDGSNPDLIIAMLDVEYIDSSGLGALVAGLKRVSEKSGRIFIAATHEQVRKVFVITGLISVFHMFETVDEAARALRTTPRTALEIPA